MCAPVATRVEGCQPNTQGWSWLQAGLAIQPAVAPMRAAATSHSGEATTPLGPCKLTCFFATPPNTGLGATAGPADLSAPGHDRHAQVYPETAAAAQPPQQSAATNAFYEQLGSIAAGSGVCVDIFAIGRQSLGLAALTPLCRKSGGACFFYPSVEGSALPQVRSSDATNFASRTAG